MVFEIVTGVAFLAILLLLVSMAGWVYRDAKRKHVPYAIGWSILTFVGGLPGLIVYFVVTRLGVLNLNEE